MFSMISSSCKVVSFFSGPNAESMVMIGESKNTILSNFDSYSSEFRKKSSLIDRGDTLIHLNEIASGPINSLFVFQDSINTYQELDVYCSKCADGIIDRILKDTRYNFKPIDEGRYVSTTDINAVMYLKEEDNDDKSCYIIRVNLK